MKDKACCFHTPHDPGVTSRTVRYARFPRSYEISGTLDIYMSKCAELLDMFCDCSRKTLISCWIECASSLQMVYEKFTQRSFSNKLFEFNVYGSVHHKYILIYTQQDAALHSLFISGNYSTCFERYFHPSSAAHTTVSTTSGICHTFTATCR
jgi:hypothetical protein